MGSLLPGWDERAPGIAPKGSDLVVRHGQELWAGVRLNNKIAACQDTLCACRSGHWWLFTQTHPGSARVSCARPCSDQSCACTATAMPLLIVPAGSDWQLSRILSAAEFQELNEDEENEGYFAAYAKMRK